MKKIVWIAVLALGASAVANAMTTEAPATKAPGGYGGAVAGTAVAERAEQPKPEAPAAFAGGVSQAARTPQAQPPTTETPGPFGGFAATRRTTRRRSPTAPRVEETAPAPKAAYMGVPGSAAPVPAPRVAGIEFSKALTFKLRDVSTGVSYGPFRLGQGLRIRIGDKAYAVELVGEVEELRTPEQSALEAKLRRVILPEMKFEEAKLTEALDYLSREADVNIVVVDQVRERAPDVTIRLKNIPLYDAIRYVTEVIGVHFRIDDHAVVITDVPPRTSSRGR